MEIEEGRSRKKMDISRRGPKSFFFYTITVADWCRFHQGGYTHQICWPFISLSNGNNTKYCLLGLNPSKKLRNANLEMQNNKRMKCRSRVTERRATEDMLPLTGLLLHYCDGFIIVPHRKPWAGGAAQPLTTCTMHCFVWMVEGLQACPSQDWAAVCCIEWKKFRERERERMSRGSIAQHNLHLCFHSLLKQHVFCILFYR